MEHESHLPESSVTSISTTIFGWAVAAVLIGGILYVVYTKSGLDYSANIASAYDACKASVAAGMAQPNAVQFLNTPDNTQVTEDQTSYTLLMKMRVRDKDGQVQDSSFSCAASKPKGFLQPLFDFFK